MAEQDFTPSELATEQWRAIIGYTGAYEVSNLGRIRSLPKKTRRGVRVLVPGLGSTGHPHVTLYDGRCKGSTVKVSQLVTAAFIGMRPEAHQVNHIDGDTLNNRLTNLEYVTPSANRYHACRVLGKGRGERHPNASLTNAQALVIKDMFHANPQIRNVEIEQMFSISKSVVWNIRHGRTWSWL